jgi:putative tryptophan/tyrosine transport system substrate-binding protein
MRRLAFLILLVLLAADPASTQTPARKPPLIGWLRIASAETPPGKPLIDALAARGLVEGRDYRMDVRLADGKVERFPDLARALVQDGPAIIVAFGPDATRAAKAATSTIPIVAAAAFIEEGFAPSLARPAGNLTGVSLLVTEIDPKKLEVLKELVPDAKRFGVLTDSSTAIPDRPRAQAAAAERLGVQLTTIDVKAPDALEAAFGDFQKAGATAVAVNASTTFATARNTLGEVSAKYRLPTICQWRSMVEAGCLASYGFPLGELFELIAEQTHKVWNGAKPENLPIIQPRRFELVINLKVAGELGITVPPRMIERADEVIE